MSFFEELFSIYVEKPLQRVVKHVTEPIFAKIKGLIAGLILAVAALLVLFISIFFIFGSLFFHFTHLGTYILPALYTGLLALVPVVVLALLSALAFKQ